MLRSLLIRQGCSTGWGQGGQQAEDRQAGSVVSGRVQSGCAARIPMWLFTPRFLKKRHGDICLATFRNWSLWRQTRPPRGLLGASSTSLECRGRRDSNRQLLGLSVTSEASSLKARADSACFSLISLWESHPHVGGPRGREPRIPAGNQHPRVSHLGGTSSSPGRAFTRPRPLPTSSLRPQELSRVSSPPNS